MAKGEILKRVLIALIAAVPAGGVGYFVRELLKWWGILDPFARAAGEWLKMTPAAVWNGIGLAVFLALYIFVLVVILRLYRLAPTKPVASTLSIKFEPRDPWVHQIAGNVPIPSQPILVGSNALATATTGRQTAQCIFVRFEIVASAGPLKNCKVWVRDIERLDGEKWGPTGFSPSLPLRWVETQGYDPIDVYPHGRHFVDLISTDEIWKRVFVKWKQSFIANEGIFRNSGTYKLTVACASEGGDTAAAEFILVWRGIWNDFDIEIVGAERQRVTGAAMPSVPNGLIAREHTLSKRPISFVALRKLAAEAGWNMNARAVCVGDNDLWQFMVRLRQAAADGTLTISGREYQNPYTNAKEDDTPRLLIDASHFQRYEFSPRELADAENYDIFTHDPDSPFAPIPKKVYRDLHVLESEVVRWLTDEGKPPEPADICIALTREVGEIDGWRPALAISIQNIGEKTLDDCLVKIEQMTIQRPQAMTLPFVLRTDGQIKDNRSGPFTLRKGEQKPIPILFQDKVRRNEWYLLDERRTPHFIPPQPMQIKVGLYGGTTPGWIVITMHVGPNWVVEANLETVADDYRLPETFIGDI